MKSFRNNQETNLVEEEEKEDLDKDKIFNVYKLLSGDKQELFRINVVINSMEVTMKIDTRASISIMNYNTYLKLSWKWRISLVTSNVMLHTYLGNVMKARGKFEGVFEYEDQKLKHYFVVVDGARHNLLGRDILSLTVIDWLQFLKA